MADTKQREPHTPEHETQRYYVGLVGERLTFCQHVGCEKFDQVVGS